MSKVLKGLILYNGAALLSSIVITYVLVGRKSFSADLPYILVPGLFFASVGVVVGHRLGRVNLGGLVGLVTWIICEFLFIIGLAIRAV